MCLVSVVVDAVVVVLAAVEPAADSHLVFIQTNHNPKAQATHSSKGAKPQSGRVDYTRSLTQ